MNRHICDYLVYLPGPQDPSQIPVLLYMLKQIKHVGETFENKFLKTFLNLPAAITAKVFTRKDL